VARKTAAELDALHDSGVDMSAHMDDTKTRRPHREIQRVNVDFPRPLLEQIDRAAARLGVNRQAFIKMRLAETLVTK
jgi:predicted DNA binding CopG/RHH family protein